MVSHLCLYFLELICKDKKDKEEVLYYAKGLRRSINMVIFSCSLLMIWYFYFRSDHGLKQTSGSDKVFGLGTRTLISLLIFALLWLLKSLGGKAVPRKLKKRETPMTTTAVYRERPRYQREIRQRNRGRRREVRKVTKKIRMEPRIYPPVGDQQKQEEVPKSGDSTIKEGNKAEKQTKKNGNKAETDEDERK
ncbi:hypothetical protein Droror1_Dr00013012 [Drosera rotundifolia]